jgi:hypothetical protein
MLQPAAKTIACMLRSLKSDEIPHDHTRIHDCRTRLARLPLREHTDIPNNLPFNSQQQKKTVAQISECITDAHA